MKRTTAFLLVLLMLTAMLPMTAHADGWIDEDIDQYHDSYLHPGRVYYFPLMTGSHQVSEGEDTGYRYKVEVEPRSKGVSASIVTEDGYQYVRVTVSATAARDEEYTTFDIILTSTRKNDRDDTSEHVSSFEVGYGDTYFCSDSELDIYDDQTVIEFSDSVTSCFIYLPDGHEFAATLQPNSSRNSSDGIYRIIDFYATTDPVSAIESKYGTNAWLEYLRFYTGYTFGSSLLRIYAPDHNYVYAINGSGLSRLQATRNGDFLVITTTTLGSYVISDKDLGVAYGSLGSGSSNGESSLPSSEPQAPTPMPSSGGSYPANTGGSYYKPNPGTGAAA